MTVVLHADPSGGRRGVSFASPRGSFVFRAGPFSDRARCGHQGGSSCPVGGRAGRAGARGGHRRGKTFRDGGNAFPDGGKTFPDRENSCHHGGQGLPDGGKSCHHCERSFHHGGNHFRRATCSVSTDFTALYEKTPGLALWAVKEGGSGRATAPVAEAGGAPALQGRASAHGDFCVLASGGASDAVCPVLSHPS